LARLIRLLIQRRAAGQLLIDALQLRFEPAAAKLCLLGQLPGPVGQGVVLIEAQDGRQYLLALAGRLAHELVGAALHQEGAVDEGVVVDVQDLFDAALRIPQRVAGDGRQPSGPCTNSSRLGTPGRPRWARRLWRITR
jgi:hypothetical protein